MADREPPGLRRIDHVGVVVADFQATTRLLAEDLGLPRVDGSETAVTRTAFYRCGDATIEIIEVHDPDVRRQRLGEDGTVARIEHIAFEVDDAERMLETLGRMGFQPTAPPRVSRDFLTFWTQPATSGGIMFQFLSRLGSAPPNAGEEGSPTVAPDPGRSR